MILFFHYWNYSSFWEESFPWCWICPSKFVNRILRTVTRSMQIVIASLNKAPFFKSAWVLSLKRCTKTSKIPAITYKEDIFLMKCWVFTIHSPVWLNSTVFRVIRNLHRFANLFWIYTRYEYDVTKVIAQCLYPVLNPQETSHFYWDLFWDKNDGEKWCHWNYFQIPFRVTC